jgi:hypothetical protein
MPIAQGKGINPNALLRHDQHHLPAVGSSRTNGTSEGVQKIRHENELPRWGADKSFMAGLKQEQGQGEQGEMKKIKSNDARREFSGLHETDLVKRGCIMRRKVYNAFFLATGALFLTVTLLPCAAWSQSPYPAKPINILISYAPGGVVDTTTRVLLTKRENSLGQPVATTRCRRRTVAVAIVT